MYIKFIIFFSPEPFERKLELWCSFISTYFRVFPKNKNTMHQIRNEHCYNTLLNYKNQFLKRQWWEWLVPGQVSHQLTHLTLWPPTFADAASKHATQAFFDCLRAEMEQYEIKVTVISPSYIQTSLSLNAITADGSKYGGKALDSLFFCGKLWFGQWDAALPWGFFGYFHLEYDFYN